MDGFILSCFHDVPHKVENLNDHLSYFTKGDQEIAAPLKDFRVVVLVQHVLQEA